MSKLKKNENDVKNTNMQIKHHNTKEIKIELFVKMLQEGVLNDNVFVSFSIRLSANLNAIWNFLLKNLLRIINTADAIYKGINMGRSDSIL
ncbi:hypothetical protein [Candidatus Hydrogenosomobacter endosymbioticus]|uniref:Uncharacterized protein n=1 Tax=Candidatus Hydrogenosomobacter endosymbioticus TaxID=2558174 RepID=A0ABN6L6H4_9PROT|nr:hypothetical protein [Candidatus Hydrogenosomobacter endosymbioticus]BDB96106.1 hypothetical protein HYD_2390 [Candidatus Hydrogenosomobacter endosymbioticus]